MGYIALDAWNKIVMFCYTYIHLASTSKLVRKDKGKVIDIALDRSGVGPIRGVLNGHIILKEI